jgi:AhpD family alkylhydroperoxidase
MTQFPIHTIASAPSGSADPLRALEGAIGFIPNLGAKMAEAPALIGAFVALRGVLAETELSGAKRELVAVATSVENDAPYSVAAHSAFALGQGADPEAVASARRGAAPDDPRLGALLAFARTVVAERGHISGDDLQALLDAGFTTRTAFEVVAQITSTTLANLAANIADPPLDDALASQAWAKEGV